MAQNKCFPTDDATLCCGIDESRSKYWIIYCLSSIFQ